MSTKKTKTQLEQELEQANQRITELELIAEKKVSARGKPKKAEQAQAGNEAQLRAFIEESRDGIVLFDEEGKIRIWNSAQEKITGISSKTAIGQLYWKMQLNLAIPESKKTRGVAHYKTNMQKAINSGFADPQEVVIQATDGVKKNILLSSFPIKTEHGYQVGTIARDITAEKTAQQAHQESEELFSKVFQSNPAALLVVTLKEGRILDANDAFCLQSGYAREELINHTTSDLNLWADMRDMRNAMEQFRTGNLLRNMEASLRNRSGEIRALLISFEPIFLNGEKCIISSAVDITEHKKLETALHESETRWQFALDGSGDGVWDWDAQTNKVFYSSQWKSMIGYDDGEIGNSLDEWQSRVHPDDLPAVLEKIGQHFDGSSLIYESEHRIRCKNGQYKWILDRGKVIEWTEDHKPLRVIGTHKDITERKEYESSLRQSEEQYRALVETLDVSLCRWLPDTTLVFANERYREIFGVQGNGKGQKWLDFLPAETRETTAAFYKEVAAKPSTIIYEHPVTLGDGSEHYYQWIDSPIFNASGELVEFQSVGMDITNRRHAEETLRQSETRLKGILDATPDAMVIADINGKIILANKQTEKMFGYRQDELLKMKVEQMIPERLRNRHNEYRKVFSTQTFNITTGTDRETYAMRKDGSEVPVEISLSQHKIGDEPVVLSSIRDVTERVLAANELQQNQQRLREAQEIAKLQSWSVDLQTSLFEIKAGEDHIFGWEPGKYSLDTFMRIVHPKDQKYAVKSWMKALAGEPLDIEYRILVNNETHWVHTKSKTVFDPTGNPQYVLGVTQDITERKQTANLIATQRDLAYLTNSISSNAQAWETCLQAAFQVSEMDSGGIYIFDPENGGLDLVYHKGLGKEFVETTAHFDQNSSNSKMARAGQILYFQATDLAGRTLYQNEGILSVAIIPIRHQDEVLGCLNIASHQLSEISNITRHALETIAAEIGNLIDHVRMEKTLRESEEKYHSLMDSQDSIISTLDYDGVFHYVNMIGAEQLSLMPEAVIGRNVFDFFPPETAEWQLNQVRAVISSGQGLSTEYKGMFAGRTIWRRVSIQPIRNAEGRVALAMVNSLDITDRKQAEESLKETQNRLLEAQQLAHIGHWEWNMQKEILEWSDEVYRIFGVSRENFPVTVESFENAIHPEDRERFLSERQKMLDEKQFANIDHRIILPDGQIRYVQERTQRILDSNGTVSRLVGTVQDITERKQAEDALRKNEALLAEAQRIGRIGHWEWTAPGGDMTCSDELFHILDLPQNGNNSLPMSKLSTLLVSEDRARLYEWDRKAFSEGKGLDYEFRIQISDGTLRWMHQQAQVTYDKNGQPIRMLGTIQDITERKLAEQALLRSTQILHESQKIANLGSWTADLKAGTFDATPEGARLVDWEPGVHPLGELLNIIHPDDRESMQASWEASMHGEPYDIEHRIILNGEVRWLHIMAKFTFDEEGNPLSALGVTQDVTERKQAEELRRETDDRYRLLFETMVQGVVFQDADGQVIQANPSAQDILGLTLEQLQGRTSVDPRWKSIHENGADFPGEMHPSMIALKTGIPIHNTIMGVYNPIEDTHRWINVNAVPRFIPGEEKPYQVYTTFEDITEQKQASTLQAAVYRIALDAQSTGSLQELYPKIHQTISTIMHAENFYIALYEENSDLLHFVYSVDEKDPVRSPISPSKGLTSQVLKTGKTFFYSPEQENPGVEIIGSEPKVWLGVPLITNNRTIGVMAVQHYNDAHAYTEREQNILEFVSSQVAIAINLKKTNDSLRASQASLEIAQASAHLGSWELSPENGQGLFWSREMFQLFQCDPAQGVPPLSAFMEMVHPDDRQPLLNAQEEAIVTGRVVTIEYRATLANAEMHYFNATIRPEIDAQGKLIYMLGTVLDITDIKQAFEKIRESEEKYRLLAENISDVIWVLDLQDSQFHYVSPSVMQLRGYTVEEVMAQSMTESLTPTSAEYLAGILPSRIQELDSGISKTYVDEIEQPSKDGRTVWTETTTRLIYNPETGHLEVYGASRDITQRKQMETALRDNEERLRLSISAANQGLFDLNIQTGNVIVNREYAEMLGYEPDTFVETNQAWIDRLHPDDKEVTSQLYFDYINGITDEYRAEFRQRVNGDGWKWILSMGKVVEYDANGKPLRMLGTHTDITKRKETEEATRLQNEQIRLLYEASQQLNRTLNLKEIYQTICDFMSIIAPSNTLFISAFDHDTQLITCRAYWMENKWLDVSEFPAIPLEEDGKGTQSRVIRSGNSMLINDYQAMLRTAENIYYVDDQTNEITEAEPDPEEEEVTRSAMIVPLQSGGMVKGVIQVASYHLNAYTENQLKLLEALALHIISAEQNALLYTQIQNELEVRRQTEEALRESEARARAMLQAIPDLMFRLDRQGVFLDYKADAYQLYAQNEPSLLGMRNRDISPIEFGNLIEEKISATLETGNLQTFEYQLDIPNMGLRDYEARMTPSGVDEVLAIVRDITERKKAEETLRAQEELYRLISTINADYVFSEEVDESGEPALKWVGGGFEAITGYTFEEYKRNGGWHSILHPDDREIDQNDLIALKNNQKINSEVRMINKNGEIRWVVVHANPLWDSEHQKLTGIYGAVQDITERKKAESALQTSEEKYRVLIESLDNVIASVDRNGQFLYVNDMAALQMNRTPDAMIGKNMTDLFPPQVASTQMQNIQQVINTDQALVSEAITIVEGKPRWYRTSILPIHDETRHVTQVLINSTDIHDLKVAQQNLQDLNHTLEERVRERTAEVQDLYDNSPIGYHSLDANGNILLINNTHLEWLGYTREEVLGHSFTEFITPASAANFQNVFLEFIHNGSVRDLEFELLCKNKKIIPVLISATAIYDGHGEYVMSRTSVFDNTEQKAADKALRDANLEMARAMRMKDEFLASMSHELRTPLTGILGLSEAMQMNVYGSLNEKQMTTLSNIETSGRHLLELINDILDVSKIEAGKLELQMESCSLGDICQSSIQLTKGMAGKKRQTVNFTMKPATINVRGDARRLKQILVNLLSNAVKFTPEEGMLGLDVSTNTQENVVKISIWDKGIGIAQEDLKKLFQPFVQLDSSLSRQQSGTGLGLALVQRLVELHSGSIEVQSAPGDGSRFTVTLPCLPPDSAVNRFENVQKNKFNFAMIIEDEPADADHLARYVRALGMSPIMHSSGRDVVEHVIEHQPDVIFLDLNLPDISGWDVLAKLKSSRNTRHIPVVITSVDDEKDKASQFNADGYLVKFFTLADVRTTLEKIQIHSKPEPMAVENGENNITLMIVDDNEVNISTLADYLSTQHFNVVAVKSGVDFLTQVTQVLPDVVLMDIQMPGMDGLETTRRLRALPDRRLASVPVIAITALAMPGDRENCIDAGANEYISKPFRLLEIQALIHKIVKEQRLGAGW